MSNANPSRLGQINGAGDSDALFLKVFAGEVLTAFAETNVFKERTVVRSISSGKSAQFPATWKGSASYHTPGNELTGTAINHAERVIVIDDLLVADRFIALIDEAKNHYDVRSEYSRDVGRALARAYDKNLAQVGYLASRASATVSGGFGGGNVIDADADTSADSLVTSIFDAAELLDSKDVPMEERFVYLAPAQYYLLIDSATRVINTDFNPETNGSVKSGTVDMIGGITIVKTNNLPNGTTVASGPANYQGAFTDSVALVMHRSAVGTVQLLDLAVEMAYDIRRQGTLVVAKYAVGHGILRPESAVEISKT
jgi:hypothetical protein